MDFENKQVSKYEYSVPPTKEQLRAADHAKYDEREIWSWRYMIDFQFKAEIKYMTLSRIKYYTAYLNINKIQLKAITLVKNSRCGYDECNTIEIPVRGGVTYFSDNEDGTFTIGWDYCHFWNIDNPTTLKNVKEDIDMVLEYIIEQTKENNHVD